MAAFAIMKMANGKKIRSDSSKNAIKTVKGHFPPFFFKKGNLEIILRLIIR